jgi:hypothetical protein
MRALADAVSMSSAAGAMAAPAATLNFPKSFVWGSATGP